MLNLKALLSTFLARVSLLNAIARECHTRRLIWICRILTVFAVRQGLLKIDHRYSNFVFRVYIAKLPSKSHVWYKAWWFLRITLKFGFEWLFCYSLSSNDCFLILSNTYWLVEFRVRYCRFLKASVQPRGFLPFECRTKFFLNVPRSPMN